MRLLEKGGSGLRGRAALMGLETRDVMRGWNG